MIAAAVALGLAIGLTLGALGGGGSILTVPALVYLLDLTPQEATSASLVIVGVTAVAGAVSHTRSGGTRWRAGGLLALLGIPASVLGSRLNARVDPDVLMLSFAGLILVAAAGMLLRRSGSAPDPGPTRGRRSLRGSLTLLAAGLGIGFLTGFLGVGGGFVVVPVLVILLGMPMGVAVGTSLLVIALNSAVALGSRAGTGSFAWEVIVPFTAAAVVASTAGAAVARRLPTSSLSRAFGVLLLLVAGYVAGQVLLG